MSPRDLLTLATLVFALSLGESAVKAQKIYWVATAKLQRANLDGSNVEDLIRARLAAAHGIASTAGASARS